MFKGKTLTNAAIKSAIPLRLYIPATVAIAGRHKGNGWQSLILRLLLFSCRRRYANEKPLRVYTSFAITSV
jgi:hypothetical protein